MYYLDFTVCALSPDATVTGKMAMILTTSNKSGMNEMEE